MFQRGLTPLDPFGSRSPLEELRTQDDMSVKSLGELGPVVLVFLPALGGIFCREILERVRDSRPALENRGVRLVLVHMGSPEDAKGELVRYALQYLAQIADSERELYRHFEIGEAAAAQRVRPAVLRRALGAVRHGRGRIVGEPAQLHAALLWRDGNVAAALRPSAPGEELPIESLLA